MVDSWLIKIEMLDYEIQQEYNRLYDSIEDVDKDLLTCERANKLSDAMDDLWGAKQKLEKFKNTK